MKILLHILILAFLFSCEHRKDEKLIPFKNAYQEFENADYNLSNSDHYYRMMNFDRMKFCKIIAEKHSEIFQDRKIESLVNKDISDWLRDSVFIGSSHTMNGTFLMDTTNMLILKEPFEYYIQSEIKRGQTVLNELFQIRNSMHTVNIQGKEIHYEIVPVNGKLIRKQGEYRIETTGDYIPEYMRTSGRVDKANVRYFCDLYLIDWYVLISSNGFFNDKLALKITDTTAYYHR